MVTRKPISVARAIILLSTVPAPFRENGEVEKEKLKEMITEIRELIGLNSDVRAYKNDPKIGRFQKLLDFDPSGIFVMDPFAGQGNLMFSALEYGLRASVMDYNPVAYVLMKSILEYPRKYPHLAEDVEKYGKELIERTEKELGRFYKRGGRTALYYIWCWCIKCPYCGQRVPLTNQMWLDKNGKIGYWFRFKNGDFEVEIRQLSDKKGEKHTQKEGNAICEKSFGGCGNTISYEHMTRDIAERRDKELIAVVVRSRKGKAFELPSEEDRKNFEEAAKYLKENWDSFLEEDLIPTEDLKESELFRLTNYGLKKWYEVFTERQLLVMITLLRNIREIAREIEDQEYARVIATYLTLMLCNHVDNNSISAHWNAGRLESEPALAFRRPSMVYNFVEVNPFEKARGSLYNILNNIVKGIKFVANGRLNGNIEVKLGSVLNPSNLSKADLIITDPPYLDDVAYGELSEFFYVWMYRALKDYYPELPQPTPVDEDLVLSRGRFGDLNLAKTFYINGMKRAFRNISNTLKDDGLLVVIFAHSSPEAWNMLLEILRDARFRITSSYVVHTESIANVLARGKTSFMSSIVVSCRKITEEKGAYYETLIPQVESEIRDILDRIKTEDELLEIPITDLLIMTYGKVLEVLTQYTTIKSYDPNFKPDFENLIKDARDLILREIVRKLTGRTPSSLGPEASFLLVSKIFYGGSLPADEALKLSKAYGVKIDNLKSFIRRGKEGVSLLSFKEAELPSKPENVSRDNIYQQLLFLEKLAAEKGVSAVKTTLERYDNFRPDDIERIVTLLVKSYSIKQNKGVKFSPKDKEEFDILKNIQDVLKGKFVKRGTYTLEDFLS
uniref:DUF1156 domain-containing protein n=1 Tax=Archaeoglobus fulgidus TaxID=2234 RepID=A0A7C3RMQ3_ARCFL